MSSHKSPTQVLLRESSTRAQALRRSILRDKLFLIIGGGAIRNIFIYKRIVELGVKLFVTDAADSPWPSHVSSTFLSGFLPFDFSDTSDISARFMAALAAHPELPSRFDAAFSFDESHLLPAVHLATALDLSFQDVSAVEAAQNKACMRAALDKAGLPSPRFQVIDSEQMAREAADKLGVPLIIKPTNGFHSAGVQLASTHDEAAAAFRYAAGKVRPEDDIAWGQCGDIVAEQFLSGPEVDIDVIMSDGEAVYCNVLDNWPSTAPWFEEHGFDAPSCAPVDVQRDIRAHVVECIRALGFEHGLFHAEAIYTKAGPRLLEINPRIGGGPVFQLHRAVWGVDLIEELCFIAAGLPARPVVDHTRMHCVATCFPASASGVVTNNGWLSWVRGFDGRVISFVEFLQKGEYVVGAEKDFPDNLGHLVVGARERTECLHVIYDIYEKLKIPVDGGNDSHADEKFVLNIPEGEADTWLQL